MTFYFDKGNHYFEWLEVIKSPKKLLIWESGVYKKYLNYDNRTDRDYDVFVKVLK